MALDRKRSRPYKLSETPCGYCFERYAEVWDHLIPWIHGGRTSESNLYPSCRRCNGLLSDKIFNSIEEKREHVREELIRRGKWKFPGDTSDRGSYINLPSLPTVVPKKKILAKILRSEVSDGRVDAREDFPRNKRARGRWKYLGCGMDGSELFNAFESSSGMIRLIGESGTLFSMGPMPKSIFKRKFPDFPIKYQPK